MNIINDKKKYYIKIVFGYKTFSNCYQLKDKKKLKTKNLARKKYQMKNNYCGSTK
jgi:hypothetical protein